MVRTFCQTVVVMLAAVGCSDAPTAALPAPRPGAAPITIVSTPPGATVTVNGVGVGQAPVTVALNPGPQRLRATMSGYYSAPETLIVVERDRAATHELYLVPSH
jgi:hypothetical protein